MTGDQMKRAVIKSRICLCLKIVGNIWDYVSAQLKKIYKKLHFIAENFTYYTF